MLPLCVEEEGKSQKGTSITTHKHEAKVSCFHRRSAACPEEDAPLIE